MAGGGEKAVARHRARGKLTARERIELLLDLDSPFLELAALVKRDLADLRPRDMIDIQSFLWVQGSDESA